MRLENDGEGRWKAVTSYEEPSDRQRVKAAGFAWESARQVWTTRSAKAAVALLETLDPEEIGEGVAEGIAALAKAERAKIAAAIAASAATDADIDIPAPSGLSYMPFQRAGIAAMRDRLAAGTAGILLADEMGLGKTIQVIGLLNLALAEPGRDRLRVLVIAPKIALLNWRDEIQKWLTKPHTVAVWTAAARPEADIVIVNYDIVTKIRGLPVDPLSARHWDFAVFDEGHALKNPDAARTKAIIGGKGVSPIPAHRRIFVTGTPILNRPIDLFPILKACGVDYAQNRYRYGERYCAGYNSAFGFVADGASNLRELQEKLRSTIMVRRMKADVLTELPDKVHQVVTIDPAYSEPLRKALRDEARALNAHEKAVAKAEAAKAKAEAKSDKAALDRAVASLTALRTSNFAEIAALRQRTALAKVPDIVAHVVDILESVEEGAVLVFAHHREVIDLLAEGFCAAGHDPAIITGETSSVAKQQAQDDIQVGRKRVFLGSMHACGVSITLTAASNVVFAEQDWSPGVMAQAEDRAHRIGQTGSVLVQYLIVDGSIDATLMRTSHGKAGIAAAALDTVPDEAPEPISVATVETENFSVETAPAEQPEAVPVIEPEQETPVLPAIAPADETAPPAVPDPISVAEDRNGEIIDAEPRAEAPPETGADAENEPSFVAENKIPAPAPAVEIASADPVPEPVEMSPEVEPASTAEPVRRKRGRPPLGERAMTTAERARKFRAAHGGTERTIRVSATIADGLTYAAARRGVTLDVLLTLVVDELDRGWCRPKPRRAA